MISETFNLDRFAKYAWFALALNLLVIVWGAYVRASGSGAGCGSHWPLCNGEVIPGSPATKTIVEFAHRLSSGLALALLVGALVWTFRASKKRLRGYAAAAMFFMLMEAALGAGLVLFEMVAENKSAARALWMSAHLINTFLLLGSITVLAWAASSNRRIKFRAQGNYIIAIAMVATLILGVSGAVSALGATLFPVTSMAEGLRQDFSPTANIFVRLRIYHPLIAIVVSGFLIWVALSIRSRHPGNLIRKLSRALIALTLVQLGAGAINLLLHAPLWMQLLHLFLSDLIWIALVSIAWGFHEQPAIIESGYTESASTESAIRAALS